MIEQNSGQLNSAINDFHQARRQAQLEQIMAGLTGKSATLLSYEEVREKLKAQAGSSRGLKEIPLEAIVGSVGRYADFTRSFLPRSDSIQQRWVQVDAAFNDQAGVPPIEVYQIGEAYFVLDGNHRVSVARQLGATHIEAYVTEVRPKVPLSAEVTPDELIIKARYTDFLEHTHLDELRPEADLTTTTPGHYRTLEEQIEAHRLVMAQEQPREIPYSEAVADWYDRVYRPIINLIRAQGILADFRGRTETDLYVWLAEHLLVLEKELGWKVTPEAAVSDLVNRLSMTPQRVLARVSEKMLETITPDPLEAGPPPGQWRRQRVEPRREDCLFNDILVAIDGEEGGWLALNIAMEVARREQGRLHGLYGVSSEELIYSESAQAIWSEFQYHCRSANLPGELTVEAGNVAGLICDRARWTDLVVVSLTHPPAPQLLARLGSGFRTLVRRCPRSILAVPTLPGLDPATGGLAQIDRALLAFDGSPKAQEALFVATYLACGWQIPLVVVTKGEALSQARSYLESHGVSATFVAESGPAAEVILKTAAAHQSNLIIMGGYGFTPMLEVVLGSVVDQILRESPLPLLICR